MMAKVFSWICAVLAVHILRRDWAVLRTRLKHIHQICIEDTSCRPTLMMEQLLISGEDHRFFRHGGVDLIAICRAIWNRVLLGRHEGASTIEMQIVRVVTGRFERSLRRKLWEMALATLVTRVIPKDQLPGVYLRIGYYGWKMNGIKATCQRLRLDINLQNPIDAARIVARLKYPQPREVSTRRQAQINMRARHLLQLYQRHQHDQTYSGFIIREGYASI